MLERTVRTMLRLVQVVAVVVRHAAVVVVHRLRRRIAGTAPDPLVAARAVRRTLQELGPTFVKLGQILSTRADLLDPEMESELRKLQDNDPPVPPGAVLPALEEAFGRPVGVIFTEFDWDPVAAGSIGQVHRAVLTDGTVAAVKLRRPGVVDVVELDLSLLRPAAAFAQRHWSAADRYSPADQFAEFATTLRAELDLRAEAANARRIAAELADAPGVRVPAVFDDLTGASVCTMQFVDGVRLSDNAALDAAGIDRREIARRYADAYMRMVFVHGFFHADPHPGNFLVEDDGALVILDFGMVAAIDDAVRHGLVAIMLAVVAGDGGALADALTEVGVAGVGATAGTGLASDLDGFLRHHAAVSLGAVKIDVLLADLVDVVHRNRLRLPRALSILLKAVAMCEGVARNLDPSFELVPVMLPYAQDVLRSRGPDGPTEDR